MAKRLLIFACLAALLMTACNSLPEPEVVVEGGTAFVPQVVDALDDAGLGNSIAVDAAGVPFVSYLIFPAVLEPGEIPGVRPIGVPFITTAPEGDKPGKDGAAVGVASLAEDGAWTRGGAAQSRETPNGIVIPFSPPFVQELVGMTTANSNGTDIALDDQGTKHVAWAGDDGIYYSAGADAFEAEQIYDYGEKVLGAGPIGRPGVTADGETPWVAFTVQPRSGPRVVQAMSSDGDRWTTETVATLGPCGDCPPPARTVAGVTREGVTVVYVDDADGAVKAGVRSADGSWISSTVLAGTNITGLDMAVGPDGDAYVSFYADGHVNVATRIEDAWRVVPLARANPAQEQGNDASTTGIALDDEGKLYATWHDTQTDDLVLVRADADDPAGTAETIETPGTAGGTLPSVAVTPDGARVFLTWHGASGNLSFGTLGEVGDLLIAQPSPTSEPLPPAGPADCGDDKKVTLSVIAKDIQFEQQCLVASAGEPFTIEFDNEDAATNHNVAVYPSSADLTDPLFIGDIFPGVATENYEVDALDAGEYFFRCDVHPTMTGTLAVVKGAKGR